MGNKNMIIKYYNIHNIRIMNKYFGVPPKKPE
jgi:hypothetical protein